MQLVDLGQLESITGGTRGLSGLCSGKTNTVSVDLHSLTTVEGNYGFNETFKNASNLTTLNMSSFVLPTTPYDYYFYYTFSFRLARLAPAT